MKMMGLLKKLGNAAKTVTVLYQFYFHNINQEMSSIRDFIPMCKIGEGTYSTVYKVRRRDDGHIYALKKVKMNQLTTKEQENALNEIRILASIESPAIVAYKDAFFDQSINVLCIVMEYADGGDLHHLVTETKKFRSSFHERDIWGAVRNILMGLEILHQKAIMHRDLKSANIFKTEQGYKLGDLNVSKVVAGSLAYTQTGTPYYASPEIWRDEPYDSKSDIWSLGIIIFEMAALRPPYEGRDLEELFKNIQNRPIPAIPSHYSNDLTNLIHYCLNKKANRRPTASELLKYPAFQKYFASGFSKDLVQKQNNSQQMKKQLLQTIKLPSDLTKLKDKLPNSKYQNERPQNKSALIDQGAHREYSSHRTNVVEEKYQNRSQVFRSPAARLARDNSAKVYRSPVSDVKLNQKLSEVVVKYSDRVYLSDKKSNKVQRNSSRNYQQGYLNVQKYLREEVTKRPISQNSIPRTEKVQPRIVGLQEAHAPADIESMRRKLVKKGRIFSSNNGPKPSWWG